MAIQRSMYRSLFRVLLRHPEVFPPRLYMNSMAALNIPLRQGLQQPENTARMLLRTFFNKESKLQMNDAFLSLKYCNERVAARAMPKHPENFPAFVLEETVLPGEDKFYRFFEPRYLRLVNEAQHDPKRGRSFVYLSAAAQDRLCTQAPVNVVPGQDHSERRATECGVLMRLIDVEPMNEDGAIDAHCYAGRRVAVGRPRVDSDDGLLRVDLMPTFDESLPGGTDDPRLAASTPTPDETYIIKLLAQSCLDCLTAPRKSSMGPQQENIVMQYFFARSGVPPSRKNLEQLSWWLGTYILHGFPNEDRQTFLNADTHTRFATLLEQMQTATSDDSQTDD